MRDIKAMIKEMTLEEKAGLCSGASIWTTQAIPEHGIPAIMMTDGPHGLRKQEGKGDHLGLNESIPSTCFPTAAGLASTWNRGLIEKVGIALGEECQAEEVQIILGPGVNIKRSPLCGRNFEYYSEDPYLSSQLAIQHIKGVQSQGIGTSLKHFAANNQETNRRNINAVIDERTLRELYLASFEETVKEAQPWTVMCAYNKVNGEFCSQNKLLLTDILREEWGFDGIVVSDWYAVSERECALAAGLDLEMPTSFGIGKEKIINAVRAGLVPEGTLDASVERLLKIIFRATDNKKENSVYDRTIHHNLAKEAAAESMILLKNDENILPLEKKGKIAVIGAFAKRPRYQGSGSSRIKPTRLDQPFEEIEKLSTELEVTYADGYSLDSADIDLEQIKNAKNVASKSDVTIIFAGLPDKFDAEGFDRKHLYLPDNQNALIEAVCEVQKNTVLVLINGSAIEMPWINKVKGILEAYLGGQAMAGAIADILFGNVNPSGKLAETFPLRLKDTPSYINFPGEKDSVEYREGLFVGYRYYDKTDTKPLFPFGFGLSYTNFEYSDLTINKEEMLDTEEVEVTVKIKNTGKRAGKEIVQLYVGDKESGVIRPLKELKNFEKVSLEPGEEKLVSFLLSKSAFAYYHIGIKDWYVESGEFEIMIGKSSQEILLKGTITVKSTVKVKKNITLDSTLGDVYGEPAAKPLFEMISGRTDKKGLESMGLDLSSVIEGMKLRTIATVSQGKFNIDKLKEIIEGINNGE